MKRKISVTSSRTQNRVVFESEARTLGELKQELTRQGMDHEGLTFYEGVSKTEMTDDDSILPSNLPWKGSVTNDLVFLLTESQKKIKNGSVSRKEVYGYIRDFNLQDAVLRTFGRNFTLVPTDRLMELVSKEPGYRSGTDKPCNYAPDVSSVSERKPCNYAPDASSVSERKPCRCVPEGLTCGRLAEILLDKGLITEADLYGTVTLSDREMQDITDSCR